jgi:protein-disulfide isomerase
MNPNPESSLGQPERPVTATSAGPAPAAPAGAQTRPGVSVELRLSRAWLIGLGSLLVLVTVGSLAGGARAVFGLRESVQNQEQLAAIHGELIRIRQILETDDSGDEDVQAQQTARLTLSGQPSLGSPNAPLTMVEFTDYQCPFCSRFHSQTFPLIRKAYIEPGRVRYVTLDFPLSSIHPDALRAARASHCGEEQGKYWELHDVLFNQRGRLGREAILGAVTELGLNAPRFSACLDSEAHDARIQQDLSRGRAIGISGTPTFLLGRTAGKTLHGQVIVGAQPFEVFDDLIRSLLDRT